MRSIRSRVTLVVAVGSLFGILLPTMTTISIIAPGVFAQREFLVGLLGITTMLFVLSWSIGRYAAEFAVGPLVEATARLEVVATGDMDVLDGQSALLEIAALESAVGQIVLRSRGRERRQATAVGALAHDVRTSLAAMASLIDIGADDSSRPPTHGLEIEATEASALLAEIRRMQTLTGDLVALMRSVRPNVQRTTVDVVDVAHEVARAVRMSASVEVEVRASRPSTRMAPAGLVERILRNVIDNAAKAARTRVIVEIHSGVVVVADDGPGFADVSSIAINGAHAMFEKIRSPVDHGSGLEIASRLAEACGGRVVVERSTPLGTTILVYV